jgi:hypothetical protein
VGWLLVVFNVTGSVSFAQSIPGLLAAGPDRQAAIMLGARQLGQGPLLGYALVQKNIRTLQVVWAMTIIRESGDFAARLVRGEGFTPAMFLVTLSIEIVAFGYLGAIASGRPTLPTRRRPDTSQD